MGRRKVDDKIISHTIQLRTSHVNWIKENPEIKINKFFRDQLDKFMILKDRVKQL